jgi:hypothetical protein
MRWADKIVEGDRVNTAARFLQVFSLGTWAGSILFFGAVVAPASFRLFPADEAGALVGVVLRQLHFFGVVAGILYLLATVARERSFSALASPAPILVALMIALTLYSQLHVIAAMDALRFQMGSVSAAAANSPARATFDRLHAGSVRLEIGVLVSGLIALALTIRR